MHDGEINLGTVVMPPLAQGNAAALFKRDINNLTWNKYFISLHEYTYLVQIVLVFYKTDVLLGYSKCEYYKI